MPSLPLALLMVESRKDSDPKNFAKKVRSMNGFYLILQLGTPPVSIIIGDEREALGRSNWKLLKILM